ncbi:DUF302 domain-containing protein [Conexivisphaera calida]|uniref:DUF302 domain-containing protein n=1 Tax=Conexivisphaera calida TaxID=1874277 RepID=UPI00157B7ECA|nr:DUF302 domain-containing protein [Conexivisphaera calida]
MEYRKLGRKSFQEVCEEVMPVAEKNGLGVVGGLDMSGTLRSKGFAFPDMRIFLLCNAAYANIFLSAAPEMVSILPCHLSITARDGGVEIAASLLSYLTRDMKLENDVKAVVEAADAKLKAVVDQLAS